MNNHQLQFGLCRNAALLALSLAALACSRASDNPSPRTEQKPASDGKTEKLEPGQETAMVSPPQTAEDLFPDYKPKLTPDTACDFSPSVCGRLGELPEAEIGSLPELVKALEEQKRKAKANPGRFEAGNMMFGAAEKEYHPSDEEMIEGEIGDRIAEIVAANEKKKITRKLLTAGIKNTKITYRTFTYSHVDAMGSGRFFYASEPTETVINLR